MYRYQERDEEVDSDDDEEHSEHSSNEHVAHHTEEGNISEVVDEHRKTSETCCERDADEWLHKPRNAYEGEKFFYRFDAEEDPKCCPER